MPFPSTSSDLLSASAVVANQSARLCSIMVLGDGTNAATVIIYDNASAASGKVLAKIVVKAGLTFENFASNQTIIANNGIYASISGTGAACVVHYGLSA